MPFKGKHADVEIPDISLYDYLIERVRKGKDDVAVIEYYSGGKSITFSEIDEYSKNCAGFLHKQGLRKGDHVCVCACISTKYPVMMFAILACGATVVFCNPTYSKNEMLRQFNISKPKMIFVDEEALETVKLIQKELRCIENLVIVPKCHILSHQERAHQIFVTMESFEFTTFNEMIQTEYAKDFPTDVKINPREDVALLPYSSGTTGLPKSVMLTHRNMVAHLSHRSTFSSNKSDIFYLDRPVYHAGGFGVLFIALNGPTKLICNKTDDIEDMLCAVEKYRVTQYFTVPSFMARCAEYNNIDKYDTSSLKKVMFGGAATAQSVVKKVKGKLNAEMSEIYGSTETSVVALNNEKDLYPSSVGTLAANNEAKIVDLQTDEELPINESGEILIKNPSVMKGYLKHDEAYRNTFTDDGWFRTGDVGYFDKDERLYIIDRIKEVIKYKGVQVSPSEIENVIFKLPKVTDVGVIGIPIGYDDEVPKAFVVRQDDSLSADQIHAFVKDELSDYKQLRGGVEFVNKIPKSATGKIQRQELKKMAGIL